MRCGCEYCIYNKNYVCILKEIELTGFGMCEECILVSPDWALLESEKKRQREIIEIAWLKNTDGTDRG